MYGILVKNTKKEEIFDFFNKTLDNAYVFVYNSRPF